MVFSALHKSIGVIIVTHLKNQKNRAVIYLLLVVSLGFLPSFGLFADRIYLQNGNILRGKVLNIGATQYKFKKTNGEVENVPKNKITNVIFSRGKVERGYVSFFARLLLSAGVSSEYSVTLQNSPVTINEHELKTTHRPLRADLEVGWMVIPYHLALYVGLEHMRSNLFNSKESRYSYQSATAGLSYYTPFSSFYLNNTYFSVQARMPIGGSFQLKPDYDYVDQVVLPLKRDGIGFGLSIGKEWYGYMIWGIAFTYSRDSFQSQQKVLFLPPRSVSLPISSLRPTRTEVIRTQKEIEYIGVTFSITYD